MATKKSKSRLREYRRSALMRQEIVSQLYKRGYSYTEIRKEVMARLDLRSYSLSTLHKDVQTLLEEWRKFRLDNTDYALQLELQRIDDLIKEAWQAWEKSKEDGILKTSKQKGVPVTNGEGEEDGVATTIMEQSQREVHSNGDPRYLEIIHKLLCERRKLLGLYAPEKKEVKSELNVNKEEIMAELERLRKLT